MEVAIAAQVGAQLVESPVESHLHVAGQGDDAVVEGEVVHGALGAQVDIDGFVGQHLAKVVASQQADVLLADVALYLDVHAVAVAYRGVGLQTAMGRLDYSAAEFDQGGVVM